MSLGANLRKTVSKYKSTTIHQGFGETDDWVSLGNYTLNVRMSGSYKKGFKFGKTAVIGGEQQSGKSLLAATAAREAQKEHNAFVIWIDAEHATEQSFLVRAGVDVSEDNFYFTEMGSMDDVKKFISDTVKEYDKMSETQHVFIVIDSYNALMTDAEETRMGKGEMHADQGQHAKQLKSLIKAINHNIARRNICVLGIVHSMESGDKYAPDEILTGGRGVQYFASQTLGFTKLKMKAENLENQELIDEYDDAKKIAGIRCVAKVYKSRFSKPNEKIEVQIPWPHGIDPYSGLFDYMLEEGIITPTKPGSTYYCYSGEGYDEKFYKKDFRQHADRLMELEETAA